MTFLNKPEYLLGLNGVALHPGDFVDTDEATAGVRKPLQLQHKSNSGGDLTTNAVHRQPHRGYGNHLLQPFERSRGELACIVVIDPS